MGLRQCSLSLTEPLCGDSVTSKPQGTAQLPRRADFTPIVFCVQNWVEKTLRLFILWRKGVKGNACFNRRLELQWHDAHFVVRGGHLEQIKIGLIRLRL